VRLGVPPFGRSGGKDTKKTKHNNLRFGGRLGVWKVIGKRKKLVPFARGEAGLLGSADRREGGEGSGFVKMKQQLCRKG